MVDVLALHRELSEFDILLLHILIEQGAEATGVTVQNESRVLVRDYLVYEFNEVICLLIHAQIYLLRCMAYYTTAYGLHIEVELVSIIKDKVYFRLRVLLDHKVDLLKDCV